MFVESIEKASASSAYVRSRRLSSGLSLTLTLAQSRRLSSGLSLTLTRSVPSTQFWLITHSHTRSVPSTQFWLITHSHTRSVPRHLQSLGGPEGPEGPDLRAEEAAVLHQAVLLAAINRRCGKVISVQSLTLSDRLFRCLPRLGPPSTVPRVMVLERVS